MALGLMVRVLADDFLLSKLYNSTSKALFQLLVFGYTNYFPQMAASSF